MKKASGSPRQSKGVNRRSIIKVGARVIPALALTGLALSTFSDSAAASPLGCLGTCKGTCDGRCEESCKGDCMGGCERIAK